MPRNWSMPSSYFPCSFPSSVRTTRPPWWPDAAGAAATAAGAAPSASSEIAAASPTTAGRRLRLPDPEPPDVVSMLDLLGSGGPAAARPELPERPVAGTRTVKLRNPDFHSGRQPQEAGNE